MFQSSSCVMFNASVIFDADAALLKRSIEYSPYLQRVWYTIRSLVWSIMNPLFSLYSRYSKPNTERRLILVAARRTEKIREWNWGAWYASMIRPLARDIDNDPFPMMNLGILNAAATVSLSIYSYSMNLDLYNTNLRVLPESMMKL